MLKRFLLGLAAAAALALGVVALNFLHPANAGTEPAFKAEENVKFCGTCHSMEQEVLTWQANAHKDVSCLECHVEEDPGWIRHEFVDRNTEMKKASSPLQLKVAENRCEECHQPQMEQLLKDITPKPINASTKAPDAGKPMDTKALHDKHLKGNAKTSCTDCHYSDAHGFTESSTPWREATHKLCLDCHEQKQVKIAVTGTTSCGACHTQPMTVAPVDHKDLTAWKVSHGDSAGSKTCGQCHLSDSAGPHVQLSNPQSFPSATKDACASCHSGVQMPHPDNFISTHGKVALATKTGTCESCHSASATGTAPRAGVDALSCTTCHAQPMPHPANFLSLHADKAKASPASCTACHSPANKANPNALHARSSFCLDCHKTPMPHPADFLATHGQKAEASPSTCTTCHSSANPISPKASYAKASYCADCHLTPMPHPSAFVANHGAEAKKAPATCETCHSPKNVARPTAPHANAGYCSNCHDNYEHEAGWVGTHGTAVTASCSTCHTLQGQPGQHNTCAACHTSNGKWHDAMWFAKHGPIVTKQGDASCATCHNYVEPSCSKCHRDR